jgi:hypothetical protein
VRCSDILHALCSMPFARIICEARYLQRRSDFVGALSITV